MGIDLATYIPKGDKKNSEVFEYYRPKVYERRRSSGIDDLVGHMRAILIQVDTGTGIDTIEELYLMTPYRYRSGYLSTTHRFYVLHNKPDYPTLLIMEPLSPQFVDSVVRTNQLYPLAKKKPQTRYIGEVFASKDNDAVRQTLEDQDIRFEYPGEIETPLYTANGFLFSVPSEYCGNRIGYTTLDPNDPDSLGLGAHVELTAPERARLDEADAFAERERIGPLMLGYDHMATRVLSADREDAILEFLTMVPYYFWGAYNISAMNSSTNVNRSADVGDDKISPAKVFTANNSAAIVNSFERLPMPTETFVRNFGARMHHMAVEVKDGDDIKGEKNVDFVVNTLKTKGIPFLAHVVGECLDSPNLKQIFSKHSPRTLLITEYIERCHHFDGFFTKDNVAALTAAAGQDEQFKHGHVFD